MTSVRNFPQISTPSHLREWIANGFSKIFAGKYRDEPLVSSSSNSSEHSSETPVFKPSRQGSLNSWEGFEYDDLPASSTFRRGERKSSSARNSENTPHGRTERRVTFTGPFLAQIQESSTASTSHSNNGEFDNNGYALEDFEKKQLPQQYGLKKVTHRRIEEVTTEYDNDQDFKYHDPRPPQLDEQPLEYLPNGSKRESCSRLQHSLASWRQDEMKNMEDVDLGNEKRPSAMKRLSFIPKHGSMDSECSISSRRYLNHHLPPRICTDMRASQPSLSTTSSNDVSVDRTSVLSDVSVREVPEAGRRSLDASSERSSHATPLICPAWESIAPSRGSISMDPYPQYGEVIWETPPRIPKGLPPRLPNDHKQVDWKCLLIAGLIIGLFIVAIALAVSLTLHFVPKPHDSSPSPTTSPPNGTPSTSTPNPPSSSSSTPDPTSPPPTGQTTSSESPTSPTPTPSLPIAVGFNLILVVQQPKTEEQRQLTLSALNATVSYFPWFEHSPQNYVQYGFVPFVDGSTDGFIKLNSTTKQEFIARINQELQVSNEQGLPDTAQALIQAKRLIDPSTDKKRKNYVILIANSEHDPNSEDPVEAAKRLNPDALYVCVGQENFAGAVNLFHELTQLLKWKNVPKKSTPKVVTQIVSSILPVLKNKAL